MKYLAPFKHIQYSINHNTARIVLNRPESLNALNVPMVEEVTRAVELARQDEAVKVAVLSGNGDAFSAGGDVEFMASLQGDYHRSLNFTRNLCRMFEAIHGFTRQKTLISQGHGASVGAAGGIMAASDLAFAHSNTRFAFPERRLKLVPATLAPTVIGRVGAHNASILFTTGELFDAETARSIGLVHGHFPQETLHHTVEEMAERVCRDGKEAVHSYRQSLPPVTRLARDAAIPAEITTLVKDVEELNKDMSDEGRSKTYDYTSRRLAQALVTPEAQQAIAKFWESKKPAKNPEPALSR
jgi:methylglutaconyl-CoA hydratase